MKYIAILSSLSAFAAATCQIGQIETNGACSDCAAGTYSNTTTATTCSTCATGTYSLAKASGCTDCPDFYTQFDLSTGNTNENSCKTGCKAGYEGTNAQATCVICPAGEFSNNVTMVNVNVQGCTTCAAGTTTDGVTASSSCNLCAAGFGGSACAACSTSLTSANQNTPSSNACTQCANNAGCNSQGTCSNGACTCNSGWVSATAVHNTVTACTLCDTAFYGSAGACVACPTGQSGTGGSPATAACTTCVSDAGCLNGGTCTNNACVCATGYTGTFCGTFDTTAVAVATSKVAFEVDTNTAWNADFADPTSAASVALINNVKSATQQSYAAVQGYSLNSVTVTLFQKAAAVAAGRRKRSTPTVGATTTVDLTHLRSVTSADLTSFVATTNAASSSFTSAGFAAPATPTVTSSTSNAVNGTLSDGQIIGIVIGVCGAVLLAIVAFMCFAGKK